MEHQDEKPWWKQMERETGKVKDPFGDDVRGVKWTVRGGGFLAQAMNAIKGWFRH